MLLKCLKQIQLGLLFDLDAEIIQLLDRRVAGKEVRRSGTEGNDLQIGKAISDTGDRKKLVDPIRQILRVSYPGLEIGDIVRLAFRRDEAAEKSQGLESAEPSEA